MFAGNIPKSQTVAYFSGLWLAILQVTFKGFVMPESLVNLRREVLALESEARDLRSAGRHALAISIEREMRSAQERFEKAALTYKKLGLIS